MQIKGTHILSNCEYTESAVNFKIKRKSFKNKKRWIQAKEDMISEQISIKEYMDPFNPDKNDSNKPKK